MSGSITFDSERDIAYAHSHPALDDVMHIVHAAWHGIRSATGALPGHKLTIPHEGDLDGNAVRHILGLISHHDIRTICFQGYSGLADWLARDIKKHFGSDVRIHVITHVTSTQFENHFEMQMQEKIATLLRLGILRAHGSVKADFDSVAPGCWSRTLINAAPRIGDGFVTPAFDPDCVFIPLENTWRKNLYTNILAANAVPQVRRIYTVNWPSMLETVADLSKVKLIGYKRGLDLYATMASCSVMIAATLAECQPMTELEGLAVGTPSVSGPLLLKEFDDDPLTKLSRVPAVDNPRAIAKVVDRLMSIRRSSPAEVAEMIDAHLKNRLDLCFESYGEFFGL